MEHDNRHAPSEIPQVELAAEIVPSELAHHPLDRLTAAFTALLEDAKRATPTPVSGDHAVFSRGQLLANLLVVRTADTSTVFQVWVDLERGPVGAITRIVVAAAP